MKSSEASISDLSTGMRRRILEFVTDCLGRDITLGGELHEKRSSELYTCYYDWCLVMEYQAAGRDGFYAWLGQFFTLVKDYMKYRRLRKNSQAARPAHTAQERPVERRDFPDRVPQFAAAYLIPGKDEQGRPYEVRTSEAYRAYVAWCRENHYHRESGRVFNAKLSQRFEITRKRPQGGGEKTTMLVGCRLRELEKGGKAR